MQIHALEHQTIVRAVNDQQGSVMLHDVEYPIAYMRDTDGALYGEVLFSPPAETYITYVDKARLNEH